jgi:ABC-type lipoprotein release transport system permease subunit
VPVPLVLLMVPAVILIANVVAWWPGWSAARISPAQVLRTE